VPCYADQPGSSSYISTSPIGGTPSCPCNSGIENLFLTPLPSTPLGRNPGKTKPKIKFSCQDGKKLCICVFTDPKGTHRCFNSIGGASISIGVYPYCNSGLCQFYTYIDNCLGTQGLKLIDPKVVKKYTKGGQMITVNGKKVPASFPMLSGHTDKYLKPSIVSCDGCLNIQVPTVCSGPNSHESQENFK